MRQINVKKVWSNYVRITFYIFVSQWLGKFSLLFVYIFCCSLIEQRNLHLWHSRDCSNCWPHNLGALEKTLLAQHSWGAVYSSRQTLGGCPCPPWSRGRAMPPLSPRPNQPAWCYKPFTEPQFVCLLNGGSIPFLPAKILYAAEIFNPSTLG